MGGQQSSSTKAVARCENTQNLSSIFSPFPSARIGSRIVSVKSLAGKLEEFGLKEFVDVYRLHLCSKTVNPTRIATCLNFDADEIAKIAHPPDNFARNARLYQLIQKNSEVRNFLEALDETGNEHILKFIKETEFSTASSTLNRSQPRGIWFNIPYPIDSFCGREDFLSLLHDRLKPRDESETEVTVLSQVKIVSGLGGIGKTQTAIQYVIQHQTSYNNFIWINAETENSMRSCFLNLAEKIQIPVQDSEGKSKEIQDIVNKIYNKVCEGGKSNLIVFDNAEDYESCRQFLPFELHAPLKRPTILVTSRNQEWVSSTGKIQVLRLDALTESESFEFISKELEIEDSPEFREESRDFIELMGGLPLALQQAVAYIKQENELRKFLGSPYKISDYIKEFKSSMKKFLTFSPVPVPDYSPTVFVTWNVTFEKIQKLANGEEAVKVLEILSFLYADKIPSTFLRDLVPEMKDREFSGALKLLQKYSLIKMNVRDFSLSIHRQLQFVVLQYLKDCGDVSNVVRNLVDKCTVVLKNIKISESSDIFLNIHQIASNQFDLIPMTEKFMDFMYEFAMVLSLASRYSESLDLFKKVYSKRCYWLGEDHERTLKAQHQIAVNMFSLGRYDESLKLYKEILEKEEIHLGLDHPATIQIKHNIAMALRQQKKYQESLELLTQVLAQMNKIYGQNHPRTLTTQSAIASLHSDLGNFSRALHSFENIEKKQTEILGPHHTSVLTTKHNKASVLMKMGKFQEASKIFNEVYEKEKEILGENHLQTIDTLFCIAVTLGKEGKFTEALHIFKKVYDIRKMNLGEDHPGTISVRSKIINAEHKRSSSNDDDDLQHMESTMKQSQLVCADFMETGSVSDSKSEIRNKIESSLTFLCKKTVNVAKFAMYLLQFKLLEEQRFHELMRIEDNFAVCYYIYQDILKLDSLPSLQNVLAALNASGNSHIVKHIMTK